MARGRILVAVARLRAPLALGVAGACLAAALGYALIAPDHYRATATLFFAPSFADATAGDGAPLPVRGKESDLLRSERVAQRVVENQQLAQEPSLRAIYLHAIDSGEPPQEALAQYLTTHVDVAGGTGSEGGLVRLSVTLEDPALAARVADAYAQAWGEVSLGLRTAAIRSGIEGANRELAGLRARLGEAQARRSGAAPLGPDARAEDEFMQLSRLATQPSALPTAPGSIVAVAEQAHAASSVLPPAPNLDGSDAAVASLPSPPVATPATSSADDEIRLAQQSLERAEERMARLSVEDIGAPFPVHLLRAAAVPTVPTKPSLAASAGLGIAVGLLLAIAAAAIAETVDPRVRRPADLSRATGLVVLGCLPVASEASAPAGVSPRRLFGVHAGQAT